MWSSLLALSFFAISAVRVSGAAVDYNLSECSDADPSVLASTSSGDKVAAAWYAGWHASKFPPEQVSWDKYTHMTYSFAVTTPDASTLSLADSSPDTLPAFVSAAKQNGVKALVSLGGWTGSAYFSSNVASAATRSQLVKAVVDLAQKYELDGIDFDWEYPNKEGNAGNVLAPQDAANFLELLKELKADPVGGKLILTAAASIKPWNGPDGNPLSDVSDFANLLDYVAIMNYDISGSWLSYVGPNAPLDDSCAPAANQQGSATSAIKAWTDAGFPANKLVLGVPAYGRSFSVSAADALDGNTLKEFPTFNKGQQPTGDAWGGVDGIFNFWGLIDAGYLDSNGKATSSVVYNFDQCSKTPFVYDQQKQVMISYDDAESFSAKGDFISQNGLLGFAMWEAAGDSNDILLDSIRQSAGFQGGASNLASNSVDEEDC